MIKAKLTFCSCVVACLIGPPGRLDAEEKPEIDERFRHLIPAATAIDRAVFEKIATSPTAPTAESFNEQSLTAELMQVAFKPDDDGGAKGQFRFLSDRQPKPTKLAAEMYRSIGRGKLRVVLRPVTMIQSERITRCQADVTDDKATGSFDFLVPDLYQGNADFVAKKVGKDWRIMEFQMKTLGIHIARDDQGKWQRVEKAEDTGLEPATP